MPEEDLVVEPLYFSIKDIGSFEKVCEFSLFLLVGAFEYPALDLDIGFYVCTTIPFTVFESSLGVVELLMQIALTKLHHR